MNTQITTGKKKLANEINRAFSAMESAKKNYVFSVINLGEKLLQARESIGFGEWEDFVNRNSEFRFEARQARKYMLVAKHKELVIATFGDQDFRPSINQLTKVISQKALPAPGTDGDDEIIGRLMVEPSHTLGRDDGVIDAEFSRVAPQTAETPTQASDEPEIEDTEDYYDIEPDNWEPELDEDQAEVGVPEDVQAELKRLLDDNAWMKSIFEDDNHTSAAIHEIEKLKTINDALQGRVDSLLAENAEMLGRLNYLAARCKKLEKAHAK